MPPDPNTNLLTLTNRNLPICVACRSCGHRALIEPVDITTRDRNDHQMTTVQTVAQRLRCNQCRRRDVAVSIPVTRREAKRFMDAVRQ